MHKHSFRHVKEKCIILSNITNLSVTEQTLVLIPTWIVKSSNVISIQTKNYPDSFVGVCQYMQNGISITKSNKHGTEIQLQMNQISSYH